MSLLQDAMQATMKKAVQLAPEKMLPGGTPDALADTQGAIGRPLPRVDGALKVRGEAQFAAEFPLDGMVYAALVYSTIARGRIVELDTAAAEDTPGVVLVMTYENAPRLKNPQTFMSAPKAAAPSDLPIMQNAEIHWNGEPVAVVLAESQEQANHAATFVQVSYDERPAVTSFAAAKEKAHPPESVVGEPPVLEIGDAEAALAAAPFSVDAVYTTPRHNHNAIELHAVTVAWDGDRLHVHDASQLVNSTAWTLAQMFEIDESQVRVTSPFVGGGFGGKCLWSHHVLAAAASRLARRPVRMTVSREGVFRIVGGRTTTEQRVALGARADGTLEAVIHTGVAAMTAHNDVPEQFTFPARHLYAAKTFKLAQEVAEMDMVANFWMRAPGESVGTFALESAMDELAERLGLDPVELRCRVEPVKDPTSGHEFSARNLVQAYREGALRFGWDRRSAVPRNRREGDWLVGMGVATATYPYYRMQGGAARIRIRRDGTAVVSSASHEMGMGTATAQAQAAADRLGLPVSSVRFEYGDTDLPAGTLAGGSSQTASIGAAVMAAYDELVPQLLKMAGRDSPLSGLKPSEVEGRDGGLRSRDEPSRAESYAAILAHAGVDEVVAEASARLPLETQRWSMHSYGAQFCEVRVNAITGETRVTRFLGSFDCGRIINPRTAASQFRGGIVMGLGLALLEETWFDERSGRIMNPSLAEYHVPVHLDVPDIDVIFTDIPDPHTPMGARGIGEIGITGVGAAVANAVYNATGRRIRDLPITLDKLM
jgi:xanthine dehydrogenase YagR molybdenum-binding subunit